MKLIEKNAPSSINPLDNMLGDTTGQHRAHLFDLNCKICTGKMPAPREETVPSKRAKVVKTASAEMVDDVEEEAGSSTGRRSEEVKETLREKMLRSNSVDDDGDNGGEDDDDEEPL